MNGACVELGVGVTGWGANGLGWSLESRVGMLSGLNGVTESGLGLRFRFWGFGPDFESIQFGTGRASSVSPLRALIELRWTKKLSCSVGAAAWSVRSAGVTVDSAFAWSELARAANASPCSSGFGMTVLAAGVAPLGTLCSLRGSLSLQRAGCATSRKGVAAIIADFALD